MISRVPLLDVNRGNEAIHEETLEVIEKIVRAGSFIGGKYCKDFESSVAKYCETEFAIRCASGSDALLVALMALGIDRGDEVICPSFTFFATASAVSRLGAVPVFVDIDPVTFNIDPTKIEKAITDKTKAIIPVDLFGQCADMDKINQVIDGRDISVVEDAAQSIGAKYKGKMSGGIADVGCFSFYPTKNLGGFGDGGIMTTNNKEIADRLRLYANHGMSPRYYHSVVGVNSRLDSMQAAILDIKLRHLDSWSDGRRENANRYSEMFRELSGTGAVTLPTETDGYHHVWNQYTIRLVDVDRDALRQKMADRGVGSEVYYPVPLHQQECFKSLNYKPGSLPETELASLEVLSLPIFPELTIEEQEMVVQVISEEIDGCRYSQKRAAA